MNRKKTKAKYRGVKGRETEGEEKGGRNGGKIIGKWKQRQEHDPNVS